MGFGGMPAKKTKAKKDPGDGCGARGDGLASRTLGGLDLGGLLGLSLLRGHATETHL